MLPNISDNLLLINNLKKITVPNCKTCATPILAPALDQSNQFCNSCINFLDQQKTSILQRHKATLADTKCPFGTDDVLS